MTTLILIKNTVFCIIVIINGMHFAKFPAEEFFRSLNVSLELPNQLEKYLCRNHSTPPCCSCEKHCREDCCIDRYWNTSASYDLASYLVIFKRIQEEKMAKDKLQCQPVLSSLLEGEISDHILMDPCDSNVSNTRQLINHIVYDQGSKRYYPSKSCINGNKLLSYVTIMAHCLHNVSDVMTGMIFSSKFRKKYRNCVFTIKDVSYKNTCSYENYKCEIDSHMRSMCRIYSAPFSGYKNPHCFHCRNNLSHPIILSNCLDFKFMDILSRNPVVLELTTTENKNELKINSIQYNFPLHTFINKTKEEIQIYDIQNIVGCKSSLDLPFCECNLDCLKRKTCCADVLWWQNQTKTITEYTSTLLLNIAKHSKEYACKSIKFNYKKTVLVTDRKYFMIANCPAESEYFDLCTRDDDVNKKFNWAFIVPVLGADDHLYKNYYCALCHSVYNFQPVNLTVSCKNDTISSGKCSLNIHQSRNIVAKIRECPDIHFIDSCNTSKELSDLCRSYLGPVNGYRNLHCLLCNVDTKDLIQAAVSGFESKRALLSWFMLIKFKKNLEVKSIKDSQDNTFCASNNFEDITKITSLSNVLECKLEKIVQNPSVDKCLMQSKLSLFITILIETNLMQEVLKDLKLENLTFYRYYQSIRGVIYKLDQPFDIVRVKNILKRFSFRFFSWKLHAELVFTPHKQPILSDLHNLFFANQFHFGKVCHKYTILDDNELIITPNCSIIYRNNLIPYHNLSFWILMNRFGIESKAAACRRYYMAPGCPLQKENSIKLFSDGSIRNQRGSLYKVDQYIPTETGALVCGTKKLEHLIKIEMFLTHILLPLSIVGYGSVIITYIGFKKLRNLPGLCTIALTTSLMIGDLMFLLNGLLNLFGYNHIFALCRLVAVLMHFFLINAYCWTLMISYDIMNHFTKHILIYKNIEARRRFWKLFMSSFFVSLAIITAAFSLDHAKVVMIGYGDDGTCVPHKFYGRVFFYVIPLFICTFLSFGLLVRTFVSLALEKRRRRKTMSRSILEKISIILMFMKIALVLGINDIIGIIQIANQSSASYQDDFCDVVIGMIYSILRSMRGIFLFVVYVCKAEVIILYKASIQMKSSFKSSEETITNEESGTDASNVLELTTYKSRDSRSIGQKSSFSESSAYNSCQ